MVEREGGDFVTKLFNLFTLFSAGLVYLMYRCFEEVCIFTPNSSRQGNSERYLICKKKRSGVQVVVEYLKHVNRKNYTPHLLPNTAHIRRFAHCQNWTR